MPALFCHVLSRFVVPTSACRPGFVTGQTVLSFAKKRQSLSCKRGAGTPQTAGPGAAGAPSGSGGSRRPKEWFVHIMFLSSCQEVFAPFAPKRTGPPSPCAGPGARRRVRPGAGVISQGPHAFGRARELRPARRRPAFPAPFRHGYALTGRAFVAIIDKPFFGLWKEVLHTSIPKPYRTVLRHHAIDRQRKLPLNHPRLNVAGMEPCKNVFALSFDFQAYQRIVRTLPIPRLHQLDDPTAPTFQPMVRTRSMRRGHLTHWVWASQTCRRML